MNPKQSCPDCASGADWSRRRFVKTVGLTTAAAVSSTLPASPLAAAEKKSKPENLVEKLYDSLTPKQKEKICFAWDHMDDERGLLRTHVSNNWNITDRDYNVGGDFFTSDQRDLVEAIFFGLYNREWHAKIKKQLQDDAGGYGKRQTIAIFGKPGDEKFEFVMTGRHLTIRCDGDTTEHMAFGGPIFYGHAAQGFNEEADHPGNVFWHQALKANKLYEMLDGKQRKQALVASAPRESKVGFQGRGGTFSGILVAELTDDQKKHAQSVLQTLLEPYRLSDRQEAMRCLKAQGGLDECRIAFYQSGDIGNDKVWDIWRLEGPSFVWHYRGAPHVHVWVNVADDPSPKLNARG